MTRQSFENLRVLLDEGALQAFTDECSRLKLNPSKVKAVFDCNGSLEDLRDLQSRDFSLGQNLIEN
jgi:hypothetical protein